MHKLSFVQSRIIPISWNIKFDSGISLPSFVKNVLFHFTSKHGDNRNRVSAVTC